MKFESTEVSGFDHAFRGMRNPKNSWDKSDSKYVQYGENNNRHYLIGKNDMNLAQKLIEAGTEHRKFLRQIQVWVNITAPLYWWKEFDTYKVGTTANSTSTMHKLANTPITLDCFEIADYVPDLEVMYSEEYNKEDLTIDSLINQGELCMIDALEKLRIKYIETKDKRYWKELIRWLPESWLQTRTVSMNYENIRTMYMQRKYHKLIEWSEYFIGWTKSLPYFKELIAYEKDGD